MDEVQAVESPQVLMDNFMESAFDEIEAQENPVTETEPHIGASGEEPPVEAAEDTEPETGNSDTAEDEGDSDEPAEGRTVSRFMPYPKSNSSFLRIGRGSRKATTRKKLWNLQTSEKSTTRSSR